MTAEELRAQFERNGLNITEMMVANHRYNHDVELEAIKWIAEKRAEDHLRNDRESASDRATALSAKLAAWIAAIAATIAAIAAIISIVVELNK